MDVEIEARENPRKWMSFPDLRMVGRSGDWGSEGDNLRRRGTWKFSNLMGGRLPWVAGP
jgi:hypothetical protein